MLATKKKKKPRRSSEPSRYRGVQVKLEEIDYKNVALLQRLTSAQGKLFSRKRTGLSAEAQRKVSLALKRARQMGLMPFIT
ncbi:MAG: 30S ribosomal protein S18 [Phycisphaerae bacterium]|jgi:small subunit ribosomal protein S18|nr:30S ribosomal protein S18 [Phycisphaerae bacterium]